jgi:cadmium resistance protein CadD (predicted permease)
MGQFIGSAGVMLGAFALHMTGNYHASITIVSLVGVVGVISALFLKMPVFDAAQSEKRSVVVSAAQQTT